MFNIYVNAEAVAPLGLVKESVGPNDLEVKVLTMLNIDLSLFF